MRLLRDEVLAEWQLDGPSPTLHVHCHVSGQERWLAPPHLRNYIFKREMALVRRRGACRPCRRMLAGHPAPATMPSVLPEPLVQPPGLVPTLSHSIVAHRWMFPAAPHLRLALLQVLDTLAYAERELLEAAPAFKHASVLVHLQSDVQVRQQARGDADSRGGQSSARVAGA